MKEPLPSATSSEGLHDSESDNQSRQGPGHVTLPAPPDLLCGHLSEWEPGVPWGGPGGVTCVLVPPGLHPAFPALGPRRLPSWGTCTERSPFSRAPAVHGSVPQGHETSRLERGLQMPLPPAGDRRQTQGGGPRGTVPSSLTQPRPRLPAQQDSSARPLGSATAISATTVFAAACPSRPAVGSAGRAEGCPRPPAISHPSRGPEKTRRGQRASPKMQILWGEDPHELPRTHCSQVSLEGKAGGRRVRRAGLGHSADFGGEGGLSEAARMSVCRQQFGW